MLIAYLEAHGCEGVFGHGSDLVQHVGQRAPVHVLQRYGDGAVPIERTVEGDQPAVNHLIGMLLSYC